MRARFPISIQISIFLVIVAFIPIAAMLMLKTYENQLLSLTENANVQQARILAASLSYNETDNISEEAARAILQKMDGRFDARIRILDAEGKVIADSSTIQADDAVVVLQERTQAESTSVQASDTFIYRLFSLPIRVWRKFRPPTASYASADWYTGKTVYDGEEIQAALQGRYGAVTRISTGGQVSVTLYSAVPVTAGQDNAAVIGVVLVSRSTYRILQNLYELRVDLGKVFLWSLAAVLLVALFLAFRISRPLKKLSSQTSDCADKNGRILFTDFAGKKRHDEIGDLSRSFTQLITKLNQRIQYTQAFSADVSHEFKNPLAAIGSSAELIAMSDGATQEQAQLGKSIVDEVSHLQSLLSGVRRISQIDGGTSGTETDSIPADEFVGNIVQRIQKQFSQADMRLSLSCGGTLLRMNADHFDRLVQNLVENAASFAHTVSVSTEKTRAEGKAVFSLTVEDDGPGIPQEEVLRIFDRFYSHRADNNSHTHSGLGLSIVRAVVDSVEGTVSVSQSNMLGGARFTVTLPCIIR